MTSGALARWGGPAGVVGGLLWASYGVFEMLEPWGVDTVYRDDVGYALVTDTSLFVAYSLPGSLALLLTALGLLGVLARLGLLGVLARLGLPAARTGRIGRLLAYVALALGALSLVGVVVAFDPLFTAGRIFGTLALGAATVVAGRAARGAGAPPGWVAALLLLGLLGLFLLPLWPLVYAVQLLPAGAGAACIALFGLGWVALGPALWSGRGASPAVASR
ncbi:MAG: hypothetical protein ABR559_06465 [Gemmatimonadota bacterium]